MNSISGNHIGNNGQQMASNPPTPSTDTFEANIPKSGSTVMQDQTLQMRSVRAVQHECLILPCIIENITEETSIAFFVNRVKLRNVTVKSKGLEFDWDAFEYKIKDVPKMKKHTLISPEYAALERMFSLILIATKEELIDKNPNRTEPELFKIACTYPKIPMNSSFDLMIDSDKKRARLTLMRHARANAHFVGDKLAPPMETLKIFEASDTSKNKCNVLPAKMYETVVSNLSQPDSPGFLSTNGLCDCTAVILYDSISSTASLTHYWTPSISGSILTKQVELTIAYGAQRENLNAIVVGGCRKNLWAPCGYFKCIEPFLIGMGIPIVETNIGGNRPANIIFDVQKCKVYGLNFDEFEKLDMFCYHRNSSKVLEWSSIITYYLNDNSSKDAALPCILQS